MKTSCLADSLFRLVPGQGTAVGAALVEGAKLAANQPLTAEMRALERDRPDIFVTQIVDADTFVVFGGAARLRGTERFEPQRRRDATARTRGPR